MNWYESQPGCSRMRPLKRCKGKEDADVVLIDIDDDEDGDVIIIDSSPSSHQKRGRSSEQMGNRRVSPQSVISIEDDDDNESYTDHLSVHEDGFADFESEVTSSQRSGQGYGIPGHARSEPNGNCLHSRDASSENCFRFRDERHEFEQVEVDSDCELMEDSSGILREQWEKAALQKKVSGKNASAFNVVNEGTHHHDHDTLFPEFDWMNLGGLSSSKKQKSAYNGDIFQEKSVRCQENVCSASFVGVRNSLYDQCGGTESRAECSSGARQWRAMNNSQGNSSEGHAMNASCSNEGSDERFHAPDFNCACIFPSYCECKRTNEFGVEKVHMEEKLQSHKACKERSDDNVIDNNTGDAFNGSVGADCEADCGEKCSQEKDGAFGKPSPIETAVGQDGYQASEGPALETDTNCVPRGGSNDMLDADGDAQYLKSDIINVKEKLKETEEYKLTMEQEMALRQQQIKLQAEEAQKLRRRKRAESLRLSDLANRQKQRLEEVRALQKQDGANLNFKEGLRSEVMKELKALELKCLDMASLLRSLGVQVEGGSPQQVHAAYKRAVLKFHPDRTSGSNIKLQVEAEEKFKLISRMKEKYKFR